MVTKTTPGGGVRHLEDGDEIELLKGYQGYLLVQVAAHLWGSVPREVRLKISGKKDGGTAFDTVLPARPSFASVDSHRRSDPLEIWLTPPDPVAFAEKNGVLTLIVQGGGQRCTATVQVRFVDKTLCIHYDDGSVACL